MVVARLMFGAGFEGMMLSKSTVLNQWFFEGELSFAANASLAISREIVFINGLLTPTLQKKIGIDLTLGVGLLLILLSILACFFLLKL